MPALGWSVGLAAGRPSVPWFDFRAGVLPAGATLTRASPGSRVGADRRVAVLPPDAPRFDHDPADGRPLGLLVEPAAVNHAVRANDAGDPAWLTYNGVVRAGRVAGAAPDGGDATRIAFGPTGGVSIADASALYQEPALPSAGGAWTASFWIRALAGATTVRLGLYPGVLPVASSGEVAVAADRWTRPWVTAAVAATPNVNFSLRNDVAGTSADVLVWGAQVEEGTVPTSLVATDAAPAARAADVLRLDWRALGVADGPRTMRLLFADGGVEDVPVTVTGGGAAVPPRARPLAAAWLV